MVDTAAGRLIIPQARAQNVQRWEYFCLEGRTRRDDFLPMLNQAGLAGWELVGVGAELSTESTDGWCFKRLLP